MGTTVTGTGTPGAHNVISNALHGFPTLVAVRRHWWSDIPALEQADPLLMDRQVIEIEAGQCLF